MANRTFIVIRCGEDVESHLPDSDSSYATLCGLDGDDPDSSVDQVTLEERWEKVTCRACYNIWRVASQYKRNVFDQPTDV